MGGALLGPGAPGLSLFGLVLGFVLGVEASGISLVRLVLGAVLGVDGTVAGRWVKLSAGPQCQYLIDFASNRHTFGFAFAFVFGLPLAYDLFQVIVTPFVTHDRRYIIRPVVFVYPGTCDSLIFTAVLTFAHGCRGQTCSGGCCVSGTYKQEFDVSCVLYQ